MKKTLRALLLGATAVAVGCGNGSDNGNRGPTGGGNGGASGGSSGAGSGAGGDDVGGGSGAGGGAGSGGTVDSGAPDGGAHCAPGKKYVSSYPYPLTNCAGQFAVRNIALPNPIGPGDKFAFSVELDASLEGTMELWGATESCGTKLELLATGPMGVGTRCLEVTPQQGTYPNLIWVWHGAGSHRDVTLCPGGSCGN
jgi:hypothetical protein